MIYQMFDSESNAMSAITEHQAAGKRAYLIRLRDGGFEVRAW